MKQKYELVFVVLIYKNIDDIQKLIPQVLGLKQSHRVIIVESYSDDKCSQNLKNIAIANDCDYLLVPNKGYGAGNNAGIKYAIGNYYFEYLVVCNADIDILKFPEVMPLEYKGKIIAPLMNTITGKPQNPYWAKENRVAEFLIYKGFKADCIWISYIGFGLYKIQRIIFLNRFRKKSRNNSVVAAAHGAFVIYSREALEKIGIPYDENMFLFAEENLLAHHLNNKQVKTIISKDIQVLHHEDGSMNVANVRQTEERKKSIIYYYEKIYKINH